MSLIFDIKRYSINDGPGIRITIFLKGCPLSCIWCHNPEGISLRKEKLYTRRKCIGCESCVEVCSHQALRLTPDGIVTDTIRCQLCGACAAACPAKAMELSGQEYFVADLMREIEKETLFMDQSGGGVTFCGGEPLMHPEFLLELLTCCGEKGIHRAVDTTLYARPVIVQQIMAETDLFLVDLKHMDSALHRQYCGVPNELILSNLQLIAAAGKDYSIRIPLIKGVNADEENIRNTANFLVGLEGNKPHVHLLPYHDIAKGKHEKRGSIYNGSNYPLETPDKEQVVSCVELFRQYGLEATVGG